MLRLWDQLMVTEGKYKVCKVWVQSMLWHGKGISFVVVWWAKTISWDLCCYTTIDYCNVVYLKSTHCYNIMKLQFKKRKMTSKEYGVV